MHQSDTTAIDQVASEIRDTDISDEALDRAPGKGAACPFTYRRDPSVAP